MTSRGLAAVADRLRDAALSLENRHREATSSVLSVSPRTTRHNSPIRHASPFRRGSPLLKSAIRPSSMTRRLARMDADKAEKSVSLALERSLTATTDRSPRRQSPFSPSRFRTVGARSSSAPMKERSLYDEIASGGQGVSLTAFSSCLTRCELNLEPQLIESMFVKADTDGDGVLSFKEFRSLEASYPTLVSCLQMRRRRRQKELAALEAVATAKAKLQALREHDERAEHDIEIAIAALAEKREVFKQKTQAAADGEARLRAARSALDASAEQAQSVNSDAHASDALLNRSRHNLKQAQGDLQAVEARRDAAAKHYKTQEAKEQAAVDRVNELQAQLAEQQQEVERQRTRTVRAANEVQISEQSCHAAKTVFETCVRDTRSVEQHLRGVEEKLDHAARREQDCDQAHRQCTRELQDIAAERNAAERQVQILVKQLEETEEDRRACRAPTQVLVAEQEAVLEQMIADCDEARAKRRQVEAEEEPVVQKEIRLRRRRHELEEDESLLHKQRQALDSKGYRDPLAVDLFSPRQMKHSLTPGRLSASPVRAHAFG
ncbi:calmodulin-like protein containing EF hand domain [Diplonema papillatum]|nr:calmodulin-like protein containing EF hand domain [Diplonema papillatum]